jgi:diaminohydroxyphosphoribosylaminopyrimidine deaminase/5-amino-6-(5-phosphoribosylamino)uracil reductase
MQRCLELASAGAGHVAPNPMVGAVLVCNGKIVSEGYHRQYGEAHAEANAISCVTDQALLRKCTLYVNLEPCNHFGKTPPCADLVISCGIPAVVIGNADPNTKVKGKGMRKLAAAGIQVVTGVMEQEGRWLNRRFFTYHEKNRPYVILKWAMSPDGFLAPPQYKRNKGITWISNPVSRSLVHKWRSEEQSVLVGRKTALYDNPMLTVRSVEGTNPLRMVIDPRDSLPRSLHLFDGNSRTMIFNHVRNTSRGNISWIQTMENIPMSEAVLEQLYRMGVNSILIEGGAATLKSFIEGNLWDEARIFTGMHPLHAGIQAPSVRGVIISDEDIAGDRLQTVINPDYLEAK